MNEQLRQDIIDEYHRLKSPFRVARSLGVDIQIVISVLETLEEVLPEREERFGGLGRPELQRYAVARRRVSGGSWNNSDPAIKRARDDYEAGLVELTTGRDGNWLILYAIPRVNPQPRPHYFRPVF